MEKARDFQLFMTEKDEKEFCKALQEFNPNIYFLDVKPTPEKDIEKRLFDDVTKSNSEFFSIVNFDFIDKNTLSNNYTMYGEYYHFEQIGDGQMQFLRSYPDTYMKGYLQHGRIADSYEAKNETKKWQNKVYNILKKLGHKVYWYYTLPDGQTEIGIKPESRYVAYPDAIQKYNGKNGKFMLDSMAKFVPEGTTIEDLQ